MDEDLQVTAVTPAPTRLADPRAAGTAGAATPSASIYRSGILPGFQRKYFVFHEISREEKIDANDQITCLPNVHMWVPPTLVTTVASINVLPTDTTGETERKAARNDAARSGISASLKGKK